MQEQRPAHIEIKGEQKADVEALILNLNHVHPDFVEILYDDVLLNCSS